jgi:hypothetical protein
MMDSTHAHGEAMDLRDGIALVVRPNRVGDIL